MMLASASRRPVLVASRWASATGGIRSSSSILWSSRGALSVVHDAATVVWTSWTSHNNNHNSNNNSNNSKYHPVNFQVRCFCAAAPPPDKKEDDGTTTTTTANDENIATQTFRSILTPKTQFYALVAGGTIGAYGISRVFLAFTNFFTHLTPTIVAKWGFYTGFGCATVVGGLALITADNMYIRADPVYRYCLKWVQNDTVVQQYLGDGIQPGSLRSYRLDPGKIDIVGKSPVWRPPRIQMIFDVTATGPPYRTGIVTCEAIKSGGFPPKLTTTFLKVDYETGNEGEEGGTREEDHTYFLKGNAEDFSRVSKRSGLSLAMLGRSVHINKAAAGRPL